MADTAAGKRVLHEDGETQTRRERGVVMTDWEVKAVQEGRKSQFRKVIKPQPDPIYPHAIDYGPSEGWHFYSGYVNACWYDGDPGDAEFWSEYGLLPPYRVGDLLWVRETWGAPYADLPGVPGGRKPRPGDRIVYRADEADDYQWSHPNVGESIWRPSIHMPKWAARLWLEVTDVRAERVQEISEEDAEAEGVEASEVVERDNGEPCYTIPFQKLWRSLHGTDNPKSWEANPWAWATTFRPVSRESVGEENEDR